MIILKHWKELASRSLRSYTWYNGLLVKRFLENDNGEEKDVIVIPKCRRETVMKLAHEGCGHIGYKRVSSLVQKCFTWPSCEKKMLLSFAGVAVSARG